MKKILYFVGVAIITCNFFSCGDGNVSCKELMNFDLLLFEWEHKTDSIISEIRRIDSSNVYFLSGETIPCNEHFFIKNEYIRERENLMRPILPVLINTLDTVLIVENYHEESKTIDIYGEGVVYSYRIDFANHLPYLVSIKSTDLSEMIWLVEKGFYKCYSQSVIGDFTCITLITKQGKNPKLEIITLTINDILY